MNNKKRRNAMGNLENYIDYSEQIIIDLRTPCCGKYLGKRVDIDDLQTLFEGFECPHCQAEMKLGFLITKEGVHTNQYQPEFENIQQVYSIIEEDIEEKIDAIDNGLTKEEAKNILQSSVVKMLKNYKIVEED